MNETLWEYENVSFVKDLGNEAVVRIRGDKAHIKCALQDDQCDVPHRIGENVPGAIYVEAPLNQLDAF